MVEDDFEIVTMELKGNHAMPDPLGNAAPEAQRSGARTARSVAAPVTQLLTEQVTGTGQLLERPSCTV